MAEQNVVIARSTIRPHHIHPALIVNRNARIERETGIVREVYRRRESGTAIRRAAEQNIVLAGSVIHPGHVDTPRGIRNNLWGHRSTRVVGDILGGSETLCLGGSAHRKET